MLPAVVVIAFALNAIEGGQDERANVKTVKGKKKLLARNHYNAKF